MLCACLQLCKLHTDIIQMEMACIRTQAKEQRKNKKEFHYRISWIQDT